MDVVDGVSDTTPCLVLGPVPPETAVPSPVAAHVVSRVAPCFLFCFVFSNFILSFLEIWNMLGHADPGGSEHRYGRWAEL